MGHLDLVCSRKKGDNDAASLLYLHQVHIPLGSLNQPHNNFHCTAASQGTLQGVDTDRAANSQSEKQGSIWLFVWEREEWEGEEESAIAVLCWRLQIIKCSIILQWISSVSLSACVQVCDCFIAKTLLLRWWLRCMTTVVYWTDSCSNVHV